MTAAQSLKIDNKFDKEKNQLATKEDIHLLRQVFFKFQTDFEKRMNGQIMWTVGTGIGIIGLIFTIIKLFIIN